MNFWVRAAIYELVIFAIVGLLYLTIGEEGVWFMVVPASIIVSIALVRGKLK
ncbi:MAG: hypothetical protein R3C08_09610 [Hyphomonas sp.]|nr:hypothetical protein [Hyphomonas sp.]HRX75303.1 hypothetical protein [Hyphomonas sp.]